MARSWEIQLPAIAFLPDVDETFAVGDLPARRGNHQGCGVFKFDDTAEEAVVLGLACTVPDTHAGTGTPKADVDFYMESDATNSVALDVFVQCVTPNGDTLDLEAASSWAAANSGTASLSGSTAGDLRRLTITLTNADAIAKGDDIRIGFRRDCDSANDTASGQLFLRKITIYEET